MVFLLGFPSDLRRVICKLLGTFSASSLVWDFDEGVWLGIGGGSK